MNTSDGMERPGPPEAGRTPARIRVLAAGGLLLAFVGFLLPALPAELPPGVRVEARIEPPRATVGDPLRLEIAVTAPRGYEVLPPALSGRTGDFAVLESLPPAAEQPPAPEMVRRTFRYTLALYRPGDAQFPPVEVTIKPPKGEYIHVSTNRLQVGIDSVLAEKDPQLRGLKGQVEIEDPYRWLRWAVPALALLAAAGLAWWLWRRRRAPETPAAATLVPIDPFAAAERELAALERQRLPEKGRAKEHYVTMSEIVRRILEAGCRISTLERTSEEILDELKQSGRFPHPTAEVHRLQALMELCDMVKFAKYNPAVSENDGAFRAARHVLELCRRPAPTASPPVS